MFQLKLLQNKLKSNEILNSCVLWNAGVFFIILHR